MQIRIYNGSVKKKKKHEQLNIRQIGAIVVP